MRRPLFERGADDLLDGQSVGYGTENDEENNNNSEMMLHNLDADAVMGTFNLWKSRLWWYLVLINMAWVLFAFHTMTWAFIHLEPQFACVQNGTNITADFNYTGACSAEVDGFDSECGTNGTHFEYSDDVGWTIVNEWDLVCDRAELARGPMSINNIGGAVSLVIVGQLSDTFGRQPIFCLGMWLSAALGLAAALSPNIVVLTVLQFFIGVANVMIRVCWVYSVELSPPSQRALMSLYMNVMWSLGYAFVGVVALFIFHWRWLYGLLTVPFLVTAAYHLVLPETLAWSLTQKRDGVIEWWVNYAGAHTGQPLDLKKYQRQEETPDEAKKPIPKRTLIDLFRYRVLLCYMIVFSYFSLTTATVYWALSLFSTTLSDNRYIGFFLGCAVELPAGIFGPLMVQWFGRRPVSIFSYALSGGALLALVFVPPKDPEVGDEDDHYAWLRMTLSMIGKFGNMLVYSSAYLLMTEILPTTLRNVGYMFKSTAGLLGGVIAPFTDGLQVTSQRIVVANMDVEKKNAYHPALQPVVFGVCSLVAGVLCFALPETADKELPADIPDVDPGPLMGRIWPHLRPQSDQTRGVVVLEEREETQNGVA